jgi:RNA polymerase sigma-70 factor (ECF subfamily)
VSDLTHVFLDSLDGSTRHVWAQLPDLEDRVAALLRLGEETWSSSFRVPEEAFLRHVAERIPSGTLPENTLSRLRLSDLYLACACALGDPRAIGLFQVHCRPEVASVLARLKTERSVGEDVVQSLYQKLLLGGPDSPPGILRYSGRGPLRRWVRVTCVRAALKQLEKQKREVPVETSLLTALAEVKPDPELDYLRQMYRGDFAQAFRAALGLLPNRDRALLKLHYFDGMTVDLLGVVYRVHRATAARWLASARATLLQRTRHELSQRLGLDDEEWRSIVRLVRSRLDVTFRSLMLPPASDGTEDS